MFYVLDFVFVFIVSWDYIVNPVYECKIWRQCCAKLAGILVQFNNKFYFPILLHVYNYISGGIFYSPSRSQQPNLCVKCVLYFTDCYNGLWKKYKILKIISNKTSLFLTVILDHFRIIGLHILGILDSRH